MSRLNFVFADEIYNDFMFTLQSFQAVTGKFVGIPQSASDRAVWRRLYYDAQTQIAVAGALATSIYIAPSINVAVTNYLSSVRGWGELSQFLTATTLVARL
jgi:hypothetical protein